MRKQSYRSIWIGLLGLLLIGSAGLIRKEIQVRQQRALLAHDPKLAAEKEFGELRRATIAHPNDSTAHWKLADFLDRNKLYSKSIVEYGTLIHLHPEDRQARLKFADTCMFLKQYPVAEAYYSQITHQDPKNLHAWQGLTAALIKERRFYEATQTGDTAVSLKKDDPDSHLLRAMAVLEYAIQFPDPMAHSSELNFARKELFILTKVLPNNGEVYYQLGRASQALLQREESAQFLEKAYQLDPNNVEAARMLAIVYRALNRDDKALKVIQGLDAAHPDDPATNDMLGQLLQASPMPDALPQAIAAFRKAAKLAPKDPYLLERLATALDKHGDYKEACADFEIVTQLNPYRSYAFEKLAALYTRLGNPQLAAKAAKVAAEMTTNEQQLKQIQELSQRHPKDINLHLILADRYRTMKMYGPSRDEYFAVLKLDPKNKRIPKKFMDSAAGMTEKGLY